MQRILLFITMVFTLAAQRGGADAALGAAIHMEEAEGNYKRAIEAYKKFLAKYSTNRPLAAKAELRLGLCYEKLGDAEARKAFERVVSKYADQKDIVAQAQAKLNKSVSAEGSFSAVRITDERIFPAGPVSRDGQWFPRVDDEHGDLMLHNLKTGEGRFLTRERTKWTQYVDRAFLSPNNQRVVFNMYRTPRTRSLELVNADATGYKVLLSATATNRDYSPCGWLPDGRTVIFIARDPSSKEATIGSIDTVNGSVAFREQLPRASEADVVLSPDGRYLSFANAGDLQLYDLSTKFLAALTKEFAVRRAPSWSADSKSLFVVSASSGANKVYSIAIGGEPVLIHTGRDNPHAYGGAADGTLILQDSEQSMDIRRVAFDPATGRLSGTPSKIKTAASGQNGGPTFSPDGRTLAYLRMRGNAFPTLVLQDTVNGQEREMILPIQPGTGSWHPDSRRILIDSFSGWGPDRPPATRILDIATGEFRKVDPEFESSQLRPGNARFSPDGSEIIFLARRGEERAIMAWNLATKQTRVIVPYSSEFMFAVDGFSPDGKFLLVDWREPVGNFKSLVLIPIQGGEPKTILKGQGYFLGFAQFAPDGKTVIANGTFTFLNDTKPGLWRIGLNGEKPEKLLEQQTIFGAPTLNPNGHEILYADGERRHSLWAIKYKR